MYRIFVHTQEGPEKTLGSDLELRARPVRAEAQPSIASARARRPRQRRFRHMDTRRDTALQQTLGNLVQDMKRNLCPTSDLALSCEFSDTHKKTTVLQD